MATDIMATSTTELTLFHSIRIRLALSSCSVQRLKSETQLNEFFTHVTTKQAMQKKLGNENKYYDRTIYVSKDLKQLCWAKPGAKDGVAKGIPFDSIIEVRVGPPTKMGKNKSPGLSDECCFSVIHKGGAVDLTLGDKDKVQKYQIALTSLVVALGGFNGSTDEFLRNLSEIENRLKNIVNHKGHRDSMSGKELKTVVGSGDDDEDVSGNGDINGNCDNNGNEDGSNVSSLPPPPQNTKLGTVRDDKILQQRARNQTRESISHYAESHFSEHKKWATYHNIAMTPKEMTQWSSLPLKTPLNPQSSTAKEKKAVDLMRAICDFMGEDGRNGVHQVSQIMATSTTQQLVLAHTLNAERSVLLYN